MSLIEELSNLYLNSKNVLGELLLSLPEECAAGATTDCCSTASDEPPTNK